MSNYLLGLFEEFISLFGKNVKAHPGFAYGLGCDNWKANGYFGKVESWSLDSHNSWFDKSKFVI